MGEWKASWGALRKVGHEQQLGEELDKVRMKTKSNLLQLLRPIALEDETVDLHG